MHCTSEGQSPSGIDKSKPEDESEEKVCPEVGENVALKALKEAFEAVGPHPEPEFEPTFADAGNPVMAVFLARFVRSDATTCSSRNSLKTLSGISPSIELATRHCYILEDPPTDLKDSVVSESMAIDGGDRGSQNDGKMENLSTHTEAEDLLADLNSKTNDSVDQDGSILSSPSGIYKMNLMPQKKQEQ